MHILHLIKTSEGATWALRLLQELSATYKDLSFSVAIPKGGKHYSEYKSVCRNVYPFEFTLNTQMGKQRKHLQKIVQTDNPDLIHSWFTQTTLFARLYLRSFKIPRIFQVVGPAHLENFMFRKGDIQSSQNNDYWVASSKYILKKYLENGVNPEKLFLNYPFIDAKKLLTDQEGVLKRDFKKEFNLSPNTRIIGTASFIYPPKFYEKTGIKGHEYLLDAFEEICKRRKDVVLVIAGSSFDGNENYLNQLKRKAKLISPNRIFFSGKYSHICEVIHNFDVFLYLSKSENLGGVFESLLFQIPTISSNKGALPELVKEKTGANLDPRNIEALVEKTFLFLNSDTSTITQNGRSEVLKIFEKERIAKTSYGIYKYVFKSGLKNKAVQIRGEFS